MEMGKDQEREENNGSNQKNLIVKCVRRYIISTKSIQMYNVHSIVRV